MTVRPVRAVDARPQADAEPRLSVEQLAGRTGMSVRNIRNHQSRGLLAPTKSDRASAITAKST